MCQNMHFIVGLVMCPQGFGKTTEDHWLVHHLKSVSFKLRAAVVAFPGIPEGDSGLCISFPKHIEHLKWICLIDIVISGIDHFIFSLEWLKVFCHIFWVPIIVSLLFAGRIVNHRPNLIKMLSVKAMMNDFLALLSKRNGKEPLGPRNSEADFRLIWKKKKFLLIPCMNVSGSWKLG